MSSIAGLLDLLSNKMHYLNQKQGMLAENVANADTPDYKQRAISAFTFGDAMKQANMTMAVTDPHHIVPATMTGVNAKTFVDKEAEETGNGNSVDIENQMLEVSNTESEYAAMTGLYRKMIGLFNTASGKGGNG